MQKIRLMFEKKQFAYLDIEAPDFDPKASRQKIAGQIHKLREEAMRRRNELAVFEKEDEFLPAEGWMIVSQEESEKKNMEE